MPRKTKDLRELKVSSFSNYGCKMAPMIRLQGRWLEEFEFKIGEPILVRCENGQLIITLDKDRNIAEKRRQAFIDGEIRKLEKRFETEKKKIYRQAEMKLDIRNSLRTEEYNTNLNKPT